MDAQAFFCFLKEFQTLIVGIAGLIGVVGTLWHESNRNRRERKTNADSEKAAVTAAFLSEIDVTKNDIEGLLEGIDGYSGQEMAFIVKVREMSIYKNFIGKISTLSPEKITKILEAYHSYEQLVSNIGKKGDGDDQSVYIVVDSGNYKSAEFYLECAKTNFETAQSVLAR